jgi:hypothetical protein
MTLRPLEVAFLLPLSERMCNGINQSREIDVSHNLGSKVYARRRKTSLSRTSYAMPPSAAVSHFCVLHLRTLGLTSAITSQPWAQVTQVTVLAWVSVVDFDGDFDFTLS